jgi:hypothetical protein
MPGMKKNHGSGGSALILVVLLIFVVLIFGATLLGITQMAYHSADAQSDGEQAYFTAKSAVDAMVSYLKDPDTTGEQVSALLDSTSTDVAMPEGMGGCEVTLSATQTSPVYDVHGHYSYTETIDVSAVGTVGEAERTYAATCRVTSTSRWETRPTTFPWRWPCWVRMKT